MSLLLLQKKGTTAKGLEPANAVRPGMGGTLGIRYGGGEFGAGCDDKPVLFATPKREFLPLYLVNIRQVERETMTIEQ